MNKLSGDIGRVDIARLEINSQTRSGELLGKPYTQNHQWNTINMGCDVGGVISIDVREVRGSSSTELIRLLMCRLYMLPEYLSAQLTPPLELIQGL